MSKKSEVLTTVVGLAAAFGFTHELMPPRYRKSNAHWKETQSEEQRNIALEKAQQKRDRKAKR